MDQVITRDRVLQALKEAKDGIVADILCQRFVRIVEHRHKRRMNTLLNTLAKKGCARKQDNVWHYVRALKHAI
jgi:hypothetical protein